MLYERVVLLDLVASLVGLSVKEDRHVSKGSRRDPPIVVVEGGRGMGKTAVLKEISRAYGNRVPRVLLDLGNRRYAQDGDRKDSGTSPLLRILQDLQWDLEMKVRRNSRLSFPRLSLALLAVATWQPDDEIDLERATKRLAEAGESVAEIARIGRDDRAGWVTDWISDVLAELAAYKVTFPADVFVRATVRAFTAKALNSRRRDVALAWHERFDQTSPGDGYQALITVSRDFHRRGAFREQAEECLVAAFLADVRAEYHGLNKLTWVGFPLALLDNADVHPAGLRLLSLVASRRAQAPSDPLVIVATGPESLAERLQALVPAGGPAGSPSLVTAVELTPLSQRSVLRMLDGADARRLPPDLSYLIHRLTAGLPLGLDIIARAVALAVPAGAPGSAGPPLDCGVILALLPAPEADKNGAASVADRLLEQLLSDPDWRFRLVVLAAARDFKAAQALVTMHLNTDRHRLAAAQAGQFLGANGLAGNPDPDHFVSEPFLRTLLLDQLRCRETQPTSAEVHGTLRDLYKVGETELLGRAEPARLYHCLALGDSAVVARRLSESFAGSDAETWLAALRVIASAPLDRHPDSRRKAALGNTDSIEHSEIHRSVSRLLHAVWYLSDPLVIPDTAVADKIFEELNFLAKLNPVGNQVLTEAATAWRKELLAWQQASDDPIKGA